MAAGHLVLQSKPRKKLTLDQVEKAANTATTCLGFDRLRRNEWTSKSGATRVFWWADADSPECAFHEQRDQISIFTGYIRDGHETWFDRRSENFNVRFPSLSKETRLNFGGVFLLLTAEDGKVIVQSSISNLFHCYFAEADDYFVLASKGMVARAVAAGVAAPSPSLMPLSSLVACRWLSHSSTIYENVCLIPADSLATLMEDGLSVTACDDAEPGFDGPLEHLSGASLDQIANELLLALEPSRSCDEKQSIGITGGKDSRLLLAAARHKGLVKSCFTSGHSSHPDVIIGARVAAALNLPHEGRDSTTAERLPELHNLRAAVAAEMFENDGYRDGWNPKFGRSSGSAPKSTTNGYGGELLRGGFLKGKALQGAELRLFVENQFRHYFFRFDDILTESAQVFHKQELYTDYVSKVSSADFAGCLLDLAYLKLRCGIWAAANQMQHRNRIVPLCDNRLLRLVYRHTNSCQRANDYLVKNLTDQLAPELREIPTLSDLATTRALRVRNIDTKSLNFWKYAAPTALRKEFLAVILSREAATNGLWEIVDRKRFQALCSSEHIFENARIKQLWSVYSVALICSGEWLSPRQARTEPVSGAYAKYRHNWAHVNLALINNLRRHQRKSLSGRSRWAAIRRLFERVRDNFQVENSEWRDHLSEPCLIGIGSSVYHAVYERREDMVLSDLIRALQPDELSIDEQLAHSYKQVH